MTAPLICGKLPNVNQRNISIRESDIRASVKQSNKNCFHLETWRKLSQKSIEENISANGRRGEPVKSTSPPFRHNKEQIASEIVISSKVM